MAEPSLLTRSATFPHRQRAKLLPVLESCAVEARGIITFANHRRYHPGGEVTPPTSNLSDTAVLKVGSPTACGTSEDKSTDALRQIRADPNARRRQVDNSYICYSLSLPHDNCPLARHMMWARKVPSDSFSPRTFIFSPTLASTARSAARAGPRSIRRMRPVLSRRET